MLKIVTALTFATLASGCAHTVRTTTDSSLAVGGNIVLTTNAAIYKCNVWQSTSAIWLSAPKEARCLKELTNEQPADNSPIFPAGTIFKVEKIKELGLVDSYQILYYMRSTDYSNTIIVLDLDLPQLDHKYRKAKF